MSVITKIHESVCLHMPFTMESISKLEISQKMNEHAWALIEGTIRDDDVDTCSHLNWKENFTIKYEDENSNQILFSGIPVSIEVFCKEQAQVSIRLCSYSMLMDYKKKSRSFQRKENTYTALFQELVKGNQGDVIDYASASSSFDFPFIQYEETDWEFLKRASSFIGACVYPCVTGTSLQIYIGFGSKDSKISKTSEWEMKKSIQEYRKFRNSDAEPLETEFISCYVTGSWDCSLGDRVSHDGQTYRVTQMFDSLKNGLLSRRCLLQIEGGICRKKIYLEKRKGVSLQGTVREVKANQIRLHLDIDESAHGEKLHWYPWHRNDWFCMPERGSKAMLYIPTGDERNSYITDINRIHGKHNHKNQDPDKKCFETKYGKEMEATPHSISFRAEGKKVSVQLSDHSGIKIRSSHDIQIYSGETFKCRSRNLKIESGERIVLSTGKTSIVMDERLQIKG